MPLFWIIVLALGGTAAIYAYAKAKDTGPSGKVWPGGISSENANRAVRIALAREDSPARLRAFAAVLERYDRPSTLRLRIRARELELRQLGILGPLNPEQIGPLR